VCTQPTINNREYQRLDIKKKSLLVRWEIKTLWYLTCPIRHYDSSWKRFTTANSERFWFSSEWQFSEIYRLPTHKGYNLNMLQRILIHISSLLTQKSPVDSILKEYRYHRILMYRKVKFWHHTSFTVYYCIRCKLPQTQKRDFWHTEKKPRVHLDNLHNREPRLYGELKTRRDQRRRRLRDPTQSWWHRR